MSTPNLYAVRLSPEQRDRIGGVARNGRAPAKKGLHARILLLADKDSPDGRFLDAQVAAALGVHVNRVARVRKLFVLKGEEPALNRKPREASPAAPKIDGRAEAPTVCARRFRRV